MEFKVRKGDFSHMGAVKGKTSMNFCMRCRKESDCRIMIYKRDHTECLDEIAVPNGFSKGNLRAVSIEGFDPALYDYNFRIDGKIVADPYAVRIVGREEWADAGRSRNQTLRCRYEKNRFLWKGDCEVEIPRKDMTLYKLHVRGFTKGLPERIKDRGTFRGLTKKLSYLKAMGVTSIELMPVYEFEEMLFLETKEIPEYTRWKPKKNDKIKKPGKKDSFKINYWGYGEGMYFAPKASYASGEAADAELKECILNMHKKGMECILEMDFPETMQKEMIVLALRHWVSEYHVDGFHLQGNRIPIECLLEDPYLGRTKLFYKGIKEWMVADEEKEYPRAFVYTDEFLYPSRKLASGMNGDIRELADQMRKQNTKLGYVNYIADNNGFTLYDLFAYGQKHNEANGENNTDGPVWNCSINCGVEGETSSRNVHKIRGRRMKNLAAMLFLSQGVPMLMAGDEDCNTQKGNNNVYCQDNEIGWKDWSSSGQAKEFLKYIRQLIAFRKQHEILRMDEPMRFADTKSCGCPDLSYHEEAAWISPGIFQRESLGILYCGRYAEETEDVYIGFNFSDLHKNLALPQKTGKRKWYLYMDTALRPAFLADPEELNEPGYTLDAQSVCIIIGK